jgi:hypothetical protein
MTDTPKGKDEPKPPLRQDRSTDSSTDRPEGVDGVIERKIVKPSDKVKRPSTSVFRVT